MLIHRNQIGIYPAYLLCLFLFIMAFSIQAQESRVVHGEVLDIITKKPIEDVNILVKSSRGGTTTNESGRFSIGLPDHAQVLVFSHISYQTNEVDLQTLDPAKKLVIYLTPESFELSEAIITAKRQFAYSVIDYEFIGNNTLLLTRKHRNNSLELLLITESYDTVARLIDLPEKRQASLFRDCFGNNHILFRDNAYQVFYSDEGLDIFHPVPRVYFLRRMQNCRCATMDYLVYERINMNQFKHDYLAIDRETSEVMEFISDLEYDKMYALNDEMQFINRNPGAFPSRGGRSLAIAYARQIAFKPAQNHIERIGDLIYYFSHGSGQLKTYSADLQLSSSVPVEYHLKDSWEEIILVDHSTDRVYTLYEIRGKYEVHEIDLSTGKTTKRAIVPLTFPENLKVNNGYLYFLYREIGNIWAKKELFRIKL